MPSISDIFSGAVQSAENSISQIVSTGAPAALASAEQYGAQQLQGLANTNIATAQAGVQSILNSPSSGGLGSVLGNVVASIGQNTLLQNYGPEILIGVAAIILIGYCLA